LPSAARVSLRFSSLAVQDILDGDICLSHRRIDNPYNQGHSHFKIGVFLGAGVPALASPVPSYREILDHHDCGRLCVSLEDWAEVLNQIEDDRPLLERWGRQAKAAMEPYSTDRVSQQYVALFESLR
jgi:hypothetical protein